MRFTVPTSGRRETAGRGTVRRVELVRNREVAMDGAGARVSVVVPVREDAGTLRPLADRLAAALTGRDWHLRLVIDASTDGSTAVAGALAAESPRIAVSG